MPKTNSVASAICFAFAATGVSASPDIDAVPVISPLQLYVIEAPGCTYCGVFRDDIAPAYVTSERGKELPLNYLDINDLPGTKLTLAAPVDIVPTFVVVKNNTEVGRVSGFVSAEDFYQSVKYILGTAK